MEEKPRYTIPDVPEQLLSYMSMDDISELPVELMSMGDSMAAAMLTQTKKIISSVVEYKELMMMYTCAMKEIRTKFEVLNAEFNVRYQRNPINFINARLKQIASITEKMERQRIVFSLQNIEDYINDVAGVRVICSYADDIYVIADALKQQDDIKLIDEKDYISNPKPNGYRSLHLIVSVPVFFSDKKKDVKVEVQIRTIAMDFWASLEHQLKYKHQAVNEEQIIFELKNCADVITNTDYRMLEIRKKIDAASGEPTEEDILFEKIRKISKPLE